MEIFQLMVFVISVFSAASRSIFFVLFCFFFPRKSAREIFVYKNKAGAKAKSGAERGRKQ